VSLFQIDAGREWRDEERRVLVLARELRRKGYPCHLVVEPDSPLHEKAAAEGLPATPLRMRGGLKWLARKRLTRMMRRSDCRLAHFHDPVGAGIGMAAAASAGVAVRVLSWTVESAPAQGRAPVRDIDAVIAPSDGLKKVLVRSGIPGNLIQVVPLGTDFAEVTEGEAGDFVRRELGLAADDFVAGVLLPLEDELGHRALLEAAAIVRERAPKVRIVVLGEGSLRLEFDQPDSVPPSDNVRYLLGRRKDFPEILRSLDMFGVFSHLEGLSGPLLYAMARGLPVAAVEVGSIREIVVHRETGLLVPPRKPKALADAFLKLHLDRVLAARLAEKGREAVLEKYSVGSMARRIVGVYELKAHRKGIKLV
jgi:L-malate glycosyltransferase